MLNFHSSIHAALGIQARTALKLTGLRTAQRSVRVCSTMGIGSEGHGKVHGKSPWEIIQFYSYRNICICIYIIYIYDDIINDI